MLRIGKLTIIGALSVGLLLACQDNKINPKGNFPTGAGGSAPPMGGIDGGQSGEVAPAPSYTYDIVPLVKNGCTCHFSGGVSPLLDSYTNVRDRANESLQSMKSGSMPEGSTASKGDIDLLQAWISAGSPNN